ncbi:MAG: hypothetical protein ACRDBL_09055 [Rhabdaerophilum sp.]
MTRIETHLAAIEAWLLALQHSGAPIVRECKRQLDLVDAEDIEKQSFKAPAAFLVLPRFRVTPRPDGGRDVLLEMFIAIASRGTATKDIDADLIGRALTLASALDDQDFGQTECSPASDVEARPVLSAAMETKGLAVVAVSWRQILYRVTPANAGVTGLLDAFGAGGPSRGSPQLFEELLVDELTDDEQAIVEGWTP